MLTCFFVNACFHLRMPKSLFDAQSPSRNRICWGGLASALLYCLESSFRDPQLPAATPLFEELCQCGTSVRLLGVEVEVKSLVIGLVVGFFLGPLIEVLGLVRQWWSYQLRARFRLAVSGGSSRSYRVLE